MTTKSLFLGLGGLGLNTILYLYSIHPSGVDWENISFFIWLQLAGFSIEVPDKSVPHRDITVLFYNQNTNHFYSAEWLNWTHCLILNKLQTYFCSIKTYLNSIHPRYCKVVCVRPYYPWKVNLLPLWGKGDWWVYLSMIRNQSLTRRSYLRKID